MTTMNDFSDVLAKAHDNKNIEKPKSLIDHLSEVEDVTKNISNTFSHWSIGDDFWYEARLAAFFHDLGKISKEFQNILNGNKSEFGFRHEILSIMLLPNFISYDQVCFKRIALAIATHHKYWDVIKDHIENRGKFYNKIILENKLFWEFCEYILNHLTKNLPLGDIKVYPQIKKCEVKIRDLKDDLQRYWRKSSPEEKFRISLLKGVLMASDHLASSSLTLQISPGITSIDDQLKSLVLPNFAWNSLQDVVVSQPISATPNLIIQAATGSGKTEAALRWACHNQNGNRRLFYVLPYQASINAMTKRLINNFDNAEPPLDIYPLHGKLEHFIELEFSNPESASIRTQLYAKQLANLARQVHGGIKITTPFQLLKLMYRVKGFTKLLVECYGGLFVWDELHCYNGKILALIISLMKQLADWGANHLIISATIPEFIINTLKNHFKEAITFYSHPAKTQHTHLFHLINNDILTQKEQIEQYLNEGKKVLVISNLVATAQDLYNLFAKYNPILLHGRFTYKDRVDKEKMIEKAEESGESRLLIGTQAIEVSLDIDYDVLFTEICPIDALLQRIGRVNRKTIKGICPVYICCDFPSDTKKSHNFIYDPEIRTKTIDAIKSLLKNNTFCLNDSCNLVNFVYENGLPEKQLKEFEQTEKILFPLWKDWDGLHQVCEDESQYHELFEDNMWQVIPLCYHDEYINAISKLRYSEADLYTVNVRKYILEKLINAGLIEFRKIKNHEIGFLLSDELYSCQSGFVSTNNIISRNTEALIYE